MADNAWSQSGCRPEVWWYGVPGAGTYYWTARFGTFWVGGGLYQKFAALGYECGGLHAPVKEYQWLTEFAAFGMWFEGGAIYYAGAAWRVAWGDYGQTTGRLTEEMTEPPAGADVEYPPERMDAPLAEPPAPPELPE